MSCFRLDVMGEKERKTMLKWMRLHGEKFPSEIMPKHGLCIWYSEADSEEERMLASATLYKADDCAIAVCGFLAANPENTMFESRKAIEMMMISMPGLAKRLGAKFIMTTFGNRGINRILNQLGYRKGDSCVEHRICKVQ